MKQIIFLKTRINNKTTIFKHPGGVNVLVKKKLDKKIIATAIQNKEIQGRKK
jgi:hypothetical protein